MRETDSPARPFSIVARHLVFLRTRRDSQMPSNITSSNKRVVSRFPMSSLLFYKKVFSAHIEHCRLLAAFFRDSTALTIGVGKQRFIME
jgi:hypothetical protein